MTEKNESCAFPLFLQGRNLILYKRMGISDLQSRKTFNGNAYVLNLVLSEKTETVDEDPWERSAEIHKFVHHERHDTGCEDIVLHKGVPSFPESLENVEVDIVLGDFFKVAPVRLRRRRKEGGIPREV